MKKHKLSADQISTLTKAIEFIAKKGKCDSKQLSDHIGLDLRATYDLVSRVETVVDVGFYENGQKVNGTMRLKNENKGKYFTWTAKAGLKDTRVMLKDWINKKVSSNTVSASTSQAA